MARPPGDDGDTSAPDAPILGEVRDVDAPRPPRRTALISAIAGTAAVLAIVGAITLIDRGSGEQTASVDQPAVPAELFVYLPPGVGLDTPPTGGQPMTGGETDIEERHTLWIHEVGPHWVRVACEHFENGRCTSVIGATEAHLTDEATGDRYFVRVAYEGADWRGWQSYLPTPDEMARGETLPNIEVDINGESGTYRGHFGGGLTWSPSEHVQVGINGVQEGELEPMLEFARSLELHRVPVPEEVPALIGDFVGAPVVAGSWTDATDAATKACVSVLSGAVAISPSGYCSEANQLAWWSLARTPPALLDQDDLPGMDLEDFFATEGPRGQVMPDASGAIAGVAPLDAEAVEVDAILPDGTRETHTTGVVGAEYGFSSGFFALDIGWRNTVAEVRVIEKPDAADPDGETDASPGTLAFYLPPGATLDDETPELVGAWAQGVGPFTVDVWCERFADGVCQSAVGSAHARFVPDDAPPLTEGITVGLVFPGGGSSAREVVRDEPESPTGQVDINGTLGSYWEEGRRLEFQPADDVIVEVHGADLDDLVEFARSLEPATAPIPDRTPARIHGFDQRRILVGAFAEGEGVQTHSTDACIAIVAFGQISSTHYPPLCTPPSEYSLHFEDGDLPPGMVVGTAPVDVGEVELSVRLTDGTTLTRFLDVVGREYGFTTGFFALDLGEGLQVSDVEIVR